MSGICAFINLDMSKARRDILMKMTNALNGSKSSDISVYLEDGVGLGYKRDPIGKVTADKAHPLTNEDNTVRMVAHGEIYNYQELRKDLEEKGHIFRSNADLEVFVHLYEDKKERCAEDIDGIFCFIIWDSRAKEMYAGRDRFGAKSFYYARINGAIVFSSDIKSILQYPGSSRTVGEKHLLEYLIFRHVVGRETLFEKIYKVLPAHTFGVKSDGTFHDTEYWNFIDAKREDRKSGRAEEIVYIEKIKEYLTKGIRNAFEDVSNTGIQLSGGIDSSLIVGLATQLKGTGLKTLSAGFDDRDYNDLRHARVVSRRFNTEHYEIVISSEDYAKDFRRAISSWGEPLKHPNTVAQHLLYKYARSNNIDFVLNGNMSDTLFGSHGNLELKKFVRYKRSIPLSSLGRLPLILGLRKIKKLDKLLRTSYEDMLLYSRAFIEPSSARDILLDYCRDDSFEYRYIFINGLKGDPDFSKKMFDYSFKPFMICNEYLCKMAQDAGIQLRFPFFDHKLVDLSATIPTGLKLRNNKEKYLIREIAKDLLPAETMKRNKMGLPVPLFEWFRDKKGLGGQLDILLEEKTKKRGIFNMPALEKMIRAQRERDEDYSGILWSALCLETWQRIFIDNERM